MKIKPVRKTLYKFRPIRLKIYQETYKPKHILTFPGKDTFVKRGKNA